MDNLLIQTTTLRGESHHPHFRDRERGSPGKTAVAQLFRVVTRTRARRPKVRTRPSATPEAGSSGLGPSPARGAVPTAALGTTAASQPPRPRPGRGGAARGCRSSSFQRRKVRPPPLARGDAAARASFSLRETPRDPRAQKPLAHTPRPRDAGLLPNWRPQEAPQALATASLTWDERDDAEPTSQPSH